MATNTRKNNWRSILLLIASLGGLGLSFLTAITILILGLVDSEIVSDTVNTSSSSLPMILIASGMLAIGLLLAPAAWFSVQRIRGKELDLFRFRPLRFWAWVVIFVIWGISIILATLLYDSPGAGWYVPLLHVLSIGIPIYLVIRLGVNRIALGSSQRAWGVFSISMTIGPILAILFELIVFFLMLIPVGIYLGLNPEKLNSFQRLASYLETSSDLRGVLPLVEPFIMDPVIVLFVLVLLAVFIPIMEEIIKSLGIWLVIDRLKSPSQGFALGILSGAGFAFAESLFASISPDEGWALTLSVRAFSGAMHILATGLVGWGIACVRLEKNYLKLAGLTLLAMLLHGLWNAGAVIAAAGGLRATVVIPDLDIPGTLMALGGASILLILIPTTLIALVFLNLKFKSPKGLPEDTPDAVR